MTSSNIIRSNSISEQVREILLERIRQGIYPSNQRMPSEEHLAQELQVSRGTLRTALAELAAEGYIDRRHGGGTFVCPDVIQIRLNFGKYWEIEQQIQEMGYQPKLQILEHVARLAKPDEIAKLNLMPNESVVIIRRLFLAGEKPVAIINSTIRANGLKDNIPPSAASLPPLYFIERFCKQKTSYAKTHFYAILADSDTADLLQVPSGSPILKWDVTHSDDEGHLFSLVEESFRGDIGFHLIMATPYK
jgi:GntR family transcriptional regulator